MAKYQEVFGETQELFDQVIRERKLAELINITLLSNDTAKEIFKVTKANELLKFRTGDDVIIVINEKIFEQLNPEQRMIVAEEAISALSFNSDKDKFEIKKPDVITFSGVLRKYSYEKWEILNESIKTLYNVEKEVEDQTDSLTSKGEKKFS